MGCLLQPLLVPGENDGHISGGPALNNPNGNDPIFAARTFDPGTFFDEFNMASSEPLLRRDSGVITGLETHVGGTNLHWGAWLGNSPVYEEFSHYSSGGASVYTSHDHNAFWFIADPTDVSLPVTGTLSTTTLWIFRVGTANP